MLMDAAKISELIRMKKKRLMKADPELVDTDARPDMNPLDTYDLQQQGRIEETIKAPEKINSDETMADESYSGVGLSPEEMKRMGRLRAYISTLDL